MNPPGISLKDVLKNGYSTHKKQNLNGYELDRNLSNGNQQVYFNKNNGKLLYNVNGTRNLKDWGVDIVAGLGGLKSTNRYKQADKTLKKAKEKYGTDAIITSHSLGGAISSRIAKPSDKVISYNKYGLGEKIKNNELAYRTTNDIVSLLNKNSKNMKTIKSHSINPVAAHDLNNEKLHNVKI